MPWTILGNWVSPFSRRQVLAAAITSLNNFFHQRLRQPSGVVYDRNRQNRLLAECMRLSGIDMPSECRFACR